MYSTRLSSPLPASQRRRRHGVKARLATLLQEPSVFSHTFIGVTDFERAFSFYTALMEVLGNSLRFCDRERPWAGWQSDPEPRPLFLIGAPYDQQAHDPGNGQMIAFLAPTHAAVDQAYRVALQQGGVSEGAPGLRPDYHAHYYGAYFRDPEGNKLCVVCHDAQQSPDREPGS
ncbi:MAG: VOC family protein [Pseudomonas sp.]|uniref:VOC family protein n=1 Tax=Pseudomonas sp. TaxID=306 RepID=UPI003394C92D